MASGPKGVGGPGRVGGRVDGGGRLEGSDGTSDHEIVGGGVNGVSTKNTR